MDKSASYMIPASTLNMLVSLTKYESPDPVKSTIGLIPTDFLPENAIACATHMKLIYNIPSPTTLKKILYSPAIKYHKMPRIPSSAADLVKQIHKNGIMEIYEFPYSYEFYGFCYLFEGYSDSGIYFTVDAMKQEFVAYFILCGPYPEKKRLFGSRELGITNIDTFNLALFVIKVKNKMRDRKVIDMIADMYVGIRFISSRYYFCIGKYGDCKKSTYLEDTPFTPSCTSGIDEVFVVTADLGDNTILDLYYR
jgi:hypothetical protein